MALLMGAYIAKHLPGVRGVRIDTSGEPLQTEFTQADHPTGHAPAPTASARPAPTLNKIEALERAGQEVSKVYRVGKSYRFAIQDTATGQWVESPLLDNEPEANDRRMQAVKRRFDELAGAGTSAER
jgi:hypothetical protein